MTEEIVSDKHMLWSRKNDGKQRLFEAYILLFGDSHSHRTDLPIIAKIRFLFLNCATGQTHMM